jgi:hypothetical protein
VLHLMQAAEKSNALKKAFKLMEQAERLDGLNPEVRKARLRLLISLATRHLQQKKTRLAEPELRQIEALPQARQGDRPALAAALRWVFWTLDGDVTQADGARATVVKVLGGEAAAQIVLRAVAAACKFKGKTPEMVHTRGPLAAAVGRACALGEDTGLRIEIPRDLSERLLRELAGKDAVADAAGLAALGEAALRADDLELAYAVSTAGLKLAQDRWAEFLFLRARAIPDWAEERQAPCAAAASELARRQRNPDLLARIGTWRDEEMISLDGNHSDVAMTTQQIDDLVQRERKLEFPAMPDGGFDYDESLCDCPSCRAERAGRFTGLPPGLPDLPPELVDMMEEMGPDVVMQALEELIGGGPPKRSRRRSRPVFGDDDVPF